MFVLGQHASGGIDRLTDQEAVQAALPQRLAEAPHRMHLLKSPSRDRPGSILRRRPLMRYTRACRRRKPLPWCSGQADEDQILLPHSLFEGFAVDRVFQNELFLLALEGIADVL